jgi:hypothetical protein
MIKKSKKINITGGFTFCRSAKSNKKGIQGRETTLFLSLENPTLSQGVIISIQIIDESQTASARRVPDIQYADFF